jgi:phosphatidylethanolamine-binding protein (PEBP) family uncharacterized protein
MRSAFACLVLSAAVALGGCGGSASNSGNSSNGANNAQATTTAGSQTSASQTSTSSTEPNRLGATVPVKPPHDPRRLHKVPTVEQVELTSPAFKPGGPIPVRYTCVGNGANTWPQFDIKGIPANTKELVLELLSEEPINGRLPVVWAVAGLSPKLHHIASGKLPAGAIVGRNWYGKTNYNVCKPLKHKELYVYVLFALPYALNPQPGFEPLAVRAEALHDAEYEGFLVFTYPR